MERIDTESLKGEPMSKLRARKRSVVVLEKQHVAFTVKSDQGRDGYLYGKPGEFKIYNEDDPDNVYGIVSQEYIDRHYEIIGEVKADGLQESPDAVVDPEPPTTQPEPAIGEPQTEATGGGEPNPHPEDGAR
jgi:hypothetical protein